jgi:hypothetical protein
MRNRWFLGSLVTLAILSGPWLMPSAGLTKEVGQTWELVNPAGAFKIIPLELAPRLSTLEGKTIALRWNAKPGGDLYLDRIAELLAQQVPTAKVIKLYAIDPSTINVLEGAALAKQIATYKPDIVISSQAD